jgi:hypothetical protein
VRVYHQLRNVHQELNGWWGGECACSRWVGLKATKAKLEQAWKDHAAEKGAK